MGRAEELAITNCILELAGAKEDATEAQLSELNACIRETLGVEARDYTRSVDAALALIPEGWGGEITWENTIQQSLVELSPPDPNQRQMKVRAVSYSLREGEKICSPLPIAICLAALNVHLSLRKRINPNRNARR
jgi:hypothetical protein